MIVGQTTRDIEVPGGDDETENSDGSDTALITGQYSAQWVKRDGKWLIRGEVFVALTCAGVGCDSKALP